MAEPNVRQTEDVNDVLKKIRDEMMKRSQLRAQKEGNIELKKLNVNLSNKRNEQQVQVKIPTVEDITRGFMRASPIFGRGFSAWMKDTVNYAHASNDELSNINKELQRIDNSGGDDTSVEYLDMMSSQLSVINNDMKDGFSNLIRQNDNISTLFSNMSNELVASNDDSSKKLYDEGRHQLKALLSINDKIGSSTGRVVGELIRLRADMQHQHEQTLMRMNEDKKDSGHNVPVATSVKPTTPNDQNGDGLPDVGAAGGFLAGAGAIAALGLLRKVLTAPIRLVKGLVGIFTNMGKFTGMLKGAGRLLKVGPLALISSIFEFGKGFFNAKEILGKADVTILDRVRAGTSELLGSFGDLVDWITKIFGFDTNFGETIRTSFLELSKKPFEWAQSVVDWFKNDLFAGINLNTSLVDIPGKIVDNLQVELTKFVDWIVDSIVGMFNSAKESMNEFVEDMKKGFAEKVKKPFFNMINTILDTIFDVVDKFVELIPDTLGGEAARRKMMEARESFRIDVEGTPEQKQVSVPVPSSGRTELSAPIREIQLPTQAATVAPLEPTTPPPMMAVTPQYGKAAMNTQEMRSAQDQQTPAINMPVIQTKNNVNNSRQTTILNSQSLQPSNNHDQGRNLWNR